MTTAALPIYGECFSSQRVFSSEEWDTLFSKNDFTPPDFLIMTRDWWDVARDISLFVLKIVICPWGLYELVRYVIGSVVLFILHPAGNKIVNWMMSSRWMRGGQENVENLQKDGFVVREVTLNKDGDVYSGFLIGHKGQINNGNWVLQTLGNGEWAEISMGSVANIYKEAGYNTLVVNGPGVGKSGGSRTLQGMGDAVEVELQFLETAVKAHNIVIAGRSLGGLMGSIAVTKHAFREDVNYMLARLVTFDSIGNIATKILRAGPLLGACIRAIMAWSIGEFDLMDASRRIDELNQAREKPILDVVVQAGFEGRISRDDVIPLEAALAKRMETEKFSQITLLSEKAARSHMSNDVFYCLKESMQKMAGISLEPTF